MTKDVFIKEVRDAEAMLYHISKSILKNDSDCGDAVIGVKYGSSQVMSGAAEVIAYGTAVKYKQD